MTQSNNKQKRKPLGPAMNEQDLDQLSTITPADLIVAAALWQNEAPKELKFLLRAQVEEQHAVN